MEDRNSLGEALETLADTLADRVAARLAALEPPPSEPQQWFSVASAAVAYAVTEQAIRSAIKSGALRAHKRGKRSLALHRDDLDAWMGPAA